MPFSTAIDNAILDHFVKKATWTQPTAVYLALSSTTPTKGGGNITEPSGGSYARVQLLAADMDAAASSANTNNAEKAFAQATADWVAGANLTALVIFDAAAAGTMIGFKLLTLAKPVLNGDTAKFPIGDIDMAMGGAN